MTASADSNARPGVWPKFPKVKNYLARFELGPIGALETRAWERDELPRLRRWAAGERFRYTVGPQDTAMELDYVVSSAQADLLRMAIVEEYFAIHAALRGEEGWHERWCKAVAMAYWAHRLQHAWHRHAQLEFDRGTRAQQLRMIGLLHGLGACVGHCIALGWFDFGIDLARRCHEAIDRGWCFDGGDDYGQRRTQHFVLRLVADWQRWPPRAGPRCAHDEPTFNTLLQLWRAPDAAVLTEPVLRACDRHTQQCRYDNARGEYFDLPVETWYTPFEVLALYRLREGLQLTNPELEHPLLATPLGRLHAPRPPWHDALLDGVVARARRELGDV